VKPLLSRGASPDAAQCEGADALLRTLGAEIESEADRRAFMSSARQVLRART